MEDLQRVGDARLSNMSTLKPVINRLVQDHPSQPSAVMSLSTMSPVEPVRALLFSQ